MMWRVLAIAAACASALEVAPLAHLGEAAPPVRLGCATSVSIPKFYQRSFYINTTLKVGDERIFLYENISIVSDAVMLYGSNFLAMHPSTGVVSRECVLSFQIDANNHNLMAAAVGISANTSLCLRFLFKPTVYRDVFAMLFSFEFQSWDAHLLCDTAHRHPTHMIDSTQAITNTSVIFSCPSEAVIPQELIQDPVHSRCDLPSTREVGIPCYVGFMSTGWFVSVLQNQTDFVYCALSVTSLSPAQAGLPGVTQLWQVVFGDPFKNVVAACGWWARVGNNLTYVVRWAESSCPTTMYNTSALVNLPNYWGPSSSPTPSPSNSPSPSHSSTQAQTGSQAPTPTQSLSPSVTPRPNLASASGFHVFGLSGPASVGVVVIVSAAVLAAVVAAALMIRRRYWGGQAYGQLSKVDAASAEEAAGLTAPSEEAHADGGFELASVPATR